MKSTSKTVTETVEPVIMSAKGVASGPVPASKYLFEWNELPAWMHVDPLIQRGYRAPLHTFQACFRSLFYTHNELMNTWTHLAPALYYCWLLFTTDSPFAISKAEAGYLDHLVIQLYILGTAGCLYLSAFYHCTNAHSEGVAFQALKCDYVGIILSITVTNIAAGYFGLRGESDLQATYVGVSLICGTTAIAFLLGPNTDGPSMAIWRTVVCGATIGSGFSPIVHKLITQGTAGIDKFPMFQIGITVSCYFLGAVIYVARMPEKYWPRTFDIWGASHQIFHSLIAIGQLVFLSGIQEKLKAGYA